MRIIFLFYFLSIILAQNSKNIQPTISSGFVQTDVLKGTLGESFFQKLESDNVALSAGFWGGVQSIITLDVENDVLPTEFSLSKAYPNPFNPTVNIDIEITQESEMEFFIYNLLGNQVFKHKEAFKQAGKYRFKWNGLSNSGKQDGQHKMYYDRTGNNVDISLLFKVTADWN